MTILIDNGHGYTTSGKQSPDGSLKEWKYTREIAAEVVQQLNDKGYEAILLTPEDDDISLSQRCKRANKYDSKTTLLVSIHNNAAGSNGEWHTASGWSVFVSNNASTKSKTLATSLANVALENNLKVRKQYSDKLYWIQNLAICRDTNCPAILTENMFMDNKEECEWLLSDEGRQTIINIHVQGIINYIEQL